MTCLPFPQHMFQNPGASPEVTLREEADACRIIRQVKKPQKNGHGQAECKCQFPLWLHYSGGEGKCIWTCGESNGAKTSRTWRGPDITQTPFVQEKHTT